MLKCRISHVRITTNIIGVIMKVINTETAIGTVLCHDLTQIIPGQYKGAKFKKGHVIKKEDIPILLSMGKKHLYVYETGPNMLHENEAAEILREICQGPGMHATEVKEGKIELVANLDGLLKIHREGL